MVEQKGERAGAGRHRFALRGTASEVNAVRRTLIADLRTLAPDSIVVETNTTSLNDEYLAQRIGLVPFSQDFLDTPDGIPTAKIEVDGRDVYARDIVPSDQSLGAPIPGDEYSDTLIAPLRSGQTLKLEVRFAVGTGREHARFVRVAAVGMRPGPAKDEHTISFDTVLPGDDARACLTEALDHLRARLERVREMVETSEQSESER